MSAIGNLLRFTPAWPGNGLTGAAYAIYAFDSTGYTTDDTLHLVWQTPGAASDLWIGLADFPRDRWDWYAGLSGGTMAYDPAKYSSSGVVYAVVLCLGSSIWVLESASITDGAPAVVLSVNPLYCNQAAPVTFSAALDGAADAYLWDFGGGATPNTSTDSAPEVTPGAPGVYSATLTVSNAYGQDAFSFSLHVGPPPGPGDWWMLGHDPQHTGRSPFVGAQTNNVKWTHDAGDDIRAFPVIAADGRYTWVLSTATVTAQQLPRHQP